MKNKLIFILLFAISLTVVANLPPTTTKGDGESNFSVTFNTDYDTIPVTRNGSSITIGTIPVSKGGTGSTAQNFVDLTTGQTIGGNKIFSDDVTVQGTTTLETSLTGPLKASSGVVSSSAIVLTSEVSGVLPIANGGTNASSILSNSKVMESRSGAIVESQVGIDVSGGLTVPTDITLSDTQFNSTEIGHQLAHFISTGVENGGILTIDAITSRFDLSAQNLTFSDYTANSDTPIIKEVDCPALDSVAVTNIATADVSYISVADDCSITQQTTAPTPQERRLKALIGRVNHPNRSTISSTVNSPDFLVAPISQAYDLMDSIGAFNVTGNIISANGANLSLNKTAGVLFRRSSNYTTDDQNPHRVTTGAITLAQFYRSTQTDLGTTLVTTLDVANYDNAGTITAIGGGVNSATNKRVYLGPTNRLAVQYGQNVYSSLSNAVAGIANESFVINPTLQENATLLAVISCTRVATDLTNSSQCVISKVSRFDTSGVSAGSGGTTNLQQAYNNSVTPQITTSTAGGSLDIKRGTAADTDKVFRTQNGAGTETFSITGAGAVSASSTLNVASSITAGSYNNKLSAFNATTSSELAGVISDETGAGSLVFAISPTFVTPNLGTPSAATLTNATGLPISTGVIGLGSGVATFLATPSSANLASALTDETGSGNAVFSTSPTLVTPTLGAASATSLAIGGSLAANTVFSASSTTAATIPAPKMTTTQKNAITPASGMAVFDTDLGMLQYYNGSQWVANTNIQLNDTYSAQMNASGTVSNENVDWINGSCAYASNEWTCTFNTGLVTAGMNCAINVTDDDTGASVRRVVSTSSNLKFRPVQDAVGYVQQPVSIVCQKGASNYQSTNAYIASNSNYDWTSFTPTFSAGFGTVTSPNCYHARDGGELLIRCRFTTGTVAASVATMTLPNSLQTLSTMSTYEIVGHVGKGNAIAFNNYVIAGPSSTTVNFSAQGATNSSLTAYNGNDVFASSTNYHIQARIPIQGWTNSNLIVASLQGTPNIPGSTVKVDTVTLNYGTTNATTSCSASPCSYLDQLGTGAVSSVTRGSTGTYTVNFARTYSKVKCVGNAIYTGGGLVLAMHPISAANSSTLGFTTVRSDTGATLDSYGVVTCFGEY